MPKILQLHISYFDKDRNLITKRRMKTSEELEIDSKKYSIRSIIIFKRKKWGKNCDQENGHYFSFIKMEGNWYMYEGSEVSQVSEDFVLGKWYPMIMFYE
jgi:ubiquitin C-terminal hydrolase